MVEAARQPERCVRKTRYQEGDCHAHLENNSISFHRTRDARPAGSLASADRGRRIDTDRAASAARVPAADLPWAGLHLDAGILGIWAGWIFLGAGNVGDGASGRGVVDSGVLGLCRGSLRVARRLLGTARRVLWRN